jgi:glycosyltransferase involved in cell wall biosynthesis
MAKTKILHIIKSLGRGGAEMLLPETLKLHNQEQFEFHYIYFLPWKDQMVEALENAGGKVTRFDATGNIQLIQQAGKINRYCKENKIGLIHAHLPWAGFVARRVHKKSGLPLFYTEHNMQERYHPITKQLNKFTFNWQSRAIGVSEEVSQSIKKNINPKIPVTTLLNGVNTKAFQQDLSVKQSVKEKWNIPQDAKVIGLVAVFRFQKRIVEWLEVFNKICQADEKVYGVIVGAGTLEEEIKAKWKELNLQDRVFFTGLQTDVKPFFNIMDVFMMTSSFEGLPIALLEAMSMKCAVVSTEAGGVEEVIRDQKDGLTCPVEDWKNLAPLVSDLFKNESKLEHFKKAARKRVVDAFSLQEMVNHLENIYVQKN